jgi:hypothetical protein
MMVLRNPGKASSCEVLSLLAVPVSFLMAPAMSTLDPALQAIWPTGRARSRKGVCRIAGEGREGGRERGLGRLWSVMKLRTRIYI